MTDLRFVGLNDDGSALVLRDDADGTFTLPLDEMVVAAVRRERPRPARLEIEMDGAMRPRDIQARIRAGASIDDVVAESGHPRERIERFAGPMLAERDHVSTLARGTEIRRDFAPDLDLESAVAERLEPLGVERDAVAWDAWRRDDGRWLVEAGYAIGREQRSGHWAFDPKAASLTADDDEGRWLIDPQAPEPTGADRGKPRLASVSALTAVTDEAESVEVMDVEVIDVEVIEAEVIEADFTDGEVIEIIEVEFDEIIEINDAATDTDDEGSDDLTAESQDALTVLDAQSHTDVAEMADAVEEQLSLVEPPEPADASTDEAAPKAPAKQRPAAARQAGKRKGRASVPTWDDIVFGSRKPSD